MQDSASAAAGDAIKQVQSSAAQLLQPLVSNVSDAITNISDTVANQQNLVTSFDALMKLFAPLVKIGDEVAKVCSICSSFYDLNRSFIKKDPSLCQFRVASALRRNEGELSWIILVLFPIYIYSTRWYKPSKFETGARSNDGEHLLVCGGRGGIEAPHRSSRYHQPNTETNNKLRVFHSKICTTQFRRYVTNL